MQRHLHPGGFFPTTQPTIQGNQGNKDKEGAEEKLKKIVRVLLCSAQPRKDSLLSPRAPKGASLVPKGLCLAAAQPVLPEGGVSKVTCRVLCHGRGPQPWHSRVIAACSELLSLGKTRPQPMAHTPRGGQATSSVVHSRTMG